MHNIILFRGGMCGDTILSMLNEKYVYDVKKLKNVKDRLLMKKFYNYSLNEKEDYFTKYNNTTEIEYTLSHDTDFCITKKENTIQIFCSNESFLPFFGERFITKNDHDDIAHRRDLVNLVEELNTDEENFVQTYTEDLRNWQIGHQFPKRIDIKNIIKKDFVNELCQGFDVNDIEWAQYIHQRWLENSESWF